jgi:hypothetical protein
MPRQAAAFHYSARREEDAATKEEEPTSSELAEKGGFMGTGLSHLYAIPIGCAVAVPILEFNWFNVNEETLVSTIFVCPSLLCNEYCLFLTFLFLSSLNPY